MSTTTIRRCVPGCAALVVAVLAVATIDPAVGRAPAVPEDGSMTVVAVPDAGAARATGCPPPPDPRVVGVPWVPREATGCATVDRWWNHVDPVRPRRSARR